MNHPVRSECLAAPSATGDSAEIPVEPSLALLRALRMVVRADSDPARQALFAKVLRSRPGVRFAWQLHDRLRGTSAGAMLVGSVGLAAFAAIAAPRNRRAKVIAVARHENARRQVARVVEWIGVDDCAAVRVGAGMSAVTNVASLLVSGQVRRTVRLFRAIDRRYGFLVSCRMAVGLAWYARGKAILAAASPRAVLVSSDSNPEEIGWVAAARALDIPQVFVSHAYPTPLSPPLEFSLSILEGEAAVYERGRRGPVKGRVVLAGVEGHSAPLQPNRFIRPNPVIGIFTPKAVSRDVLRALVEDCRVLFHARQIVIRWHPSMLERVPLADVLTDLTGVVESAGSAPLEEIAARCDWVIADENSNVHLPVLKFGIPTVAIKGLGVYPLSRSDQYGFGANGIVFPPVQSMRDVDPPALIEFFSSGWQARFQRYDASYLQPTEAIVETVRGAIIALFDAPPSSLARSCRTPSN